MTTVARRQNGPNPKSPKKKKNTTMSRAVDFAALIKDFTVKGKTIK